nr:iron-containing alcohol dehydrogenase [Saccharibacter sp. 17.LH.SD]
MNCVGVISRQETEEKLPFSNVNVFSCFAVLDPTYTYSLPMRQVVNGVVDSFVHVME